MSADTGVYVLKTITRNPEIFEYRVACLQAVDNVSWDDNQKCQTNDPDVMIKNARKMWLGHFTSNEDTAMKWALEIQKDYGWTEYGICMIEIDRVF
jgi:hypothetical protein